VLVALSALCLAGCRERPDAARLLEAARAGDEAGAGQALGAGVAPDAPGDGGVTALMVAAGAGKSGVVRLLLNRGASVNRRSEAIGPGGEAPGSSALLLAAAAGHAEVVELLLARGADPNTGTSLGEMSTTPLWHAATGGYTGIARMLLDHGAATGNGGRATNYLPLAAAVRAQSIETVQLLLDRGADPNLRDELGYTPLLWAASRGSRPISELLLAHGADVKVRTGSADAFGHEVLQARSAAALALDPGRNPELARYFESKGAPK
jgi:uncharacterized protein